MAKKSKAELAQELNEKISAAIDGADAAAAGDRMGTFTKPNAALAKLLVEEMFYATSSAKQLELLGNFNEVLLFLGAAEVVAPEKAGT